MADENARSVQTETEQSGQEASANDGSPAQENGDSERKKKVRVLQYNRSDLLI